MAGPTGAFAKLGVSAHNLGYPNLARQVIVDDVPHPEYQGTNVYGLQRVLAADGTEHLLGTVSKAAQIIDFTTGQVVYDFSHFGPGPYAGGDSYNAVAYWNGRYYFGGWIIAPSPLGTGLNTADKYTYLISTDQPDDPASWQVHVEDKSPGAADWQAEISDLIPTADYLYICRADSQGAGTGIGLWRMDAAGTMTQVFTEPAFKGAVSGNKLYIIRRQFAAAHTIDLNTGATGTLPWTNVPTPRYDSAATITYDFVWQGKPFNIAGRIATPGLHGYYLANQDGGYRQMIPLMPSAQNGSKRCLGWRNQPCAVNGGVVVAANPTDDSFQQNESPAFLLWIGPNSDVRVLDVGGYFSGCAVYGDRLYYGVSGSAHLGPFGNYQIGGVSLDSIPLSELGNRSAPFRDSISSPPNIVGSRWGGYPTVGYDKGSMVLTSSAAGDLTIWHYSSREEAVSLGTVTFTAGQTQIIDLAPYLTGGLLSFSFSVASTLTGSVSFA